MAQRSLARALRDAGARERNAGLRRRHIHTFTHTTRCGTVRYGTSK